jgi:hypothetical protein
MQHLKFQSMQLAKYHAPPGARTRATFRGNAICEKYFLMSLNAHSTLTLAFDIQLLKSSSFAPRLAPSEGDIRYGRSVYPESPNM